MNTVSDYSSLIDAYRILGRLAQDAWANPQDVPLPIARVLLHARDYVGIQLSAELLGNVKMRADDGVQTEADSFLVSRLPNSSLIDNSVLTQ